MDLFVEDERALREAALERLRDAWNADEDFPYEEASDVPFDQVVNSVVANALPLEFPGARRGQLSVETREAGEETSDDEDGQSAEREASDGGAGPASEARPDSDDTTSEARQDSDSDGETNDPVDKQF